MIQQAELRFVIGPFELGVASAFDRWPVPERFAAGTGGHHGAGLQGPRRAARPSYCVSTAGILRDEHTAMDAFQATFLVLIRKSRWLWVASRSGSWSHRVACCAVPTRRDRGRCRELERRSAELTAARTADGDRDELARCARRN